ncbi:alanine dehydrogenase [Candidatus Latescibacterota bacterium]
MKIGIPREIKPQEGRIATVPAGVSTLVGDGHTVIVERGAGEAVGFSDSDYSTAGAWIVDTHEELYDSCEMIYKVKEPLPSEYKHIKKGQIVFTYFHFAASLELTRAMQETGALCLAYETLELSDGSLPLLIPMSEIAGRMAPQCGATSLEKHNGGSGVLLGGVPGVEPARVTVIGGGISGMHAAQIAAGMGARVSILDINLARLRHLDEVMPRNVVTVYSDAHRIADNCAISDLVIGAVLIHGAPAPKLITREILSSMRPGSVFVDISVDQGGCAETTRPTTHSNPTYVEEDIIHYAVANIPGAVGRTSTFALSNATLPYARKIAAQGRDVLTEPVFESLVNIDDGKLVYPALKETFGE